MNADIALPAEGVFHNLVFVSIRKTYLMEACRKCRMTNAECRIMVGASSPRLLRCEVLLRLCANTDPQRHSRVAVRKDSPKARPTRSTEIALPREIERWVGILCKLRRDYLTGRGSKLGIDATKKLAGEGFKRPWPPLIRMDKQAKDKITALFGNVT